MPIPEYNEHGLLPPGIHSCTLSELKERFGRFSTSSQRQELFAKLEQYVQEARSAKIVSALLVDGSFVTSTEIPNDVDLVAVLAEDHDFTQELRPYQSNVLSNRWARRQFGFDLLVARTNSSEYTEYVAFFCASARLAGLKKGTVEGRSMIADERQLEQAVEQMGRMCRALAALNGEVLPKSRQQFALMAEGPLEEIRRLEEEISRYVTQTLESHAPQAAD